MVTFARDGQSQDDTDASSGDEIRHLHRALQSQPVIEQAKGLLMGQHGCTPDEAFAMLMRASQRENRKLRDIARAMIDGSSPGAADRRVLAADARDRAADARDLAADERDLAADERDLVVAQERADVDAMIARAVLRDRSAEQRDRRADQRDLVSERLLAGSDAEHSCAASDRGQSALDRYLSGVDRDLSAGDRADLQASRQHPDG